MSEPVRRLDRPAPSRAKRCFLLFMSLVQFALQIAAWVSLVRRDQRDINGPKWFWFGASFVNFVGPIAYLMGGRKISR